MSAPEFGDWWAITRVIAQYARFADEKRFEEMAELFLPDGRMLMYRPRAVHAAEAPRGREELIAAFSALAPISVTSHVLSPSVIEVEGTMAWARTTCMAHHISETPEGRIRFTLADTYDDVLVSVDGGWLFRERSKHTAWSETAPLRR